MLCYEMYGMVGGLKLCSVRLGWHQGCLCGSHMVWLEGVRSLLHFRETKVGKVKVHIDFGLF